MKTPGHELKSALKNILDPKSRQFMYEVNAYTTEAPCLP